MRKMEKNGEWVKLKKSSQAQHEDAQKLSRRHVKRAS